MVKGNLKSLKNEPASATKILANAVKEVYPSLNRYKYTSTLVFVTMVTESILERWTNLLWKVYFAFSFAH